MRKIVLVSILYPHLIKNGSSMLFLVLFSFFISSRPQRFNSSLQDTPSTYDYYENYNEEIYDEHTKSIISLESNSTLNDTTSAYDYYDNFNEERNDEYINHISSLDSNSTLNDTPSIYDYYGNYNEETSSEFIKYIKFSESMPTLNDSSSISSYYENYNEEIHDQYNNSLESNSSLSDTPSTYGYYEKYNEETNEGYINYINYLESNFTWNDTPSTYDYYENYDEEEYDENIIYINSLESNSILNDTPYTYDYYENYDEGKYDEDINFINSLESNFTWNDIPSTYDYYENYNEESYNENMNSILKRIIFFQNNEDEKTNEKFTSPLSVKTYLINTFLEGNFSKFFYNDVSRDNKSWWTDVIKEIILFLSYFSHCEYEKLLCTTNNIEEDSKFPRKCYCDSTCGVYGECCIDKAATMLEQEKITIENRMYCESLPYIGNSIYYRGIYMVGNCLPEMKGTIEEELCHRKTEYESYGVILDIPRLSLNTNITYVNYYCALCNNDSSSLLPLNITIRCPAEYLPGLENMTLEVFLSKTKYNPRELIYERAISADNINETAFMEDNSMAPFDDLIIKFTESPRLFPIYVKYSDIPPSCEVEIIQHKYVEYYASLYGSRTCKLVEMCTKKTGEKRESCIEQVTECDSSWPILADFEKCSHYSMKMYDFSKNVLFKNPHCAICNYASLEEQDQFSCTDFKNRPKITQWNYSEFSLENLVSIPNPECPNDDETWSFVHHRCIKIVCGNGRVLWKGKCIENKLEDFENNVTQSSSLLNNCPTIAVTNFTLYDNNSVFYYVENKFYEIGEYELYNESIILICAENKFYFKKNFLISYYTTVIVLSISLVCLVFHISLYFCYSRLRTWHGRNLLSLCFSLLIAQFLFLTGITATEHFEFCVFMAVCIHYFWLTSFFWMNILSIDVWRTFKTKFSRKQNSKNVFFIYNLYSWGSPFIIVITSLAVDLISQDSKYKPYYAGFEEAEICWFNNKIGHLCFFLLPVAVIITTNVVFFTITSYKIYSQSKETRFANVKCQSLKVRKQNLSEKEKTLIKQEKAKKNNKLRFASYLKLGILQGLTWVFGFFASYVDLPICWYIFTVLNGLQGAAIVLSFDVKIWIFDSIWKKISIIFMRLKFSKNTQTSTCQNDLVKGSKVFSKEIVA